LIGVNGAALRLLLEELESNITAIEEQSAETLPCIATLNSLFSLLNQTDHISQEVISMQLMLTAAKSKNILNKEEKTHSLDNRGRRIPY